MLWTQLKVRQKYSSILSPRPPRLVLAIPTTIPRSSLQAIRISLPYFGLTRYHTQSTRNFRLPTSRSSGSSAVTTRNTFAGTPDGARSWITDSPEVLNNIRTRFTWRLIRVQVQSPTAPITDDGLSSIQLCTPLPLYFTPTCTLRPRLTGTQRSLAWQTKLN